MSLDPKTRQEQYLSAIANGSEVSSVAVTREEKFLQGILNGEPPALKPITRKEMFYKAIAEGGTPGGGGSSGGGGEEWIGDGDTHIWISLLEGRTSPMLGVAINGTVTVDWGDGSEPDTLTGTNVGSTVYTPNHEYGKAGDYVITLIHTGEMKIFGTNNGCQLLTHIGDTTDYRNITYVKAITKVELAPSVVLGRYAFRDCYSLRNVFIPDNAELGDNSIFDGCYSLIEAVIPSTVTDLPGNAFRNCKVLRRVTLPDGLKSIKTGAFSSCNSFGHINIPDGVTTLWNDAFASCSALGSIVIPKSVSLIYNQAFYFCYGVAYYDFSQHEAVPTLSGTGVFNGIATDCQIRVPAALYDEWIAATNWATYADKIVGV